MSEKQTNCYLCGKKLTFLFTSLLKIDGHKVCSWCGSKHSLNKSKLEWAKTKEELKLNNQKNKDDFEKKKQEFLARKNGPKTISETRATCQSCGNIWHYGKSEQFENFTNSLNNAGNAMMCCGGCLPALFMSSKPVVDLNKCPKCGSKAVKTQQVTHEV